MRGEGTETEGGVDGMLCFEDEEDEEDEREKAEAREENAERIEVEGAARESFLANFCEGNEDKEEEKERNDFIRRLAAEVTATV